MPGNEASTSALGLHRIPDFRHPDRLDALLMEDERLDRGREAGSESRPFALLRILLQLIGRDEERGVAAFAILTALEIIQIGDDLALSANP